MGYKYSAVHNTIMHDGKDTEDAFDDAFDSRGVLKFGKAVRVPFMMRDSSAPTPGKKMWHDTPIPMTARDSASRASVDNVQLVSRQELADFDKAQLSARWKGGLSEGDRVRIGDKNLVVSGRNPTTGKIQLSDASTSASDAEARQNAYDSYDRDIQSRYLTTNDSKAGEACTTAGREAGTWREKDGRLVCVVGKSSKEFELAGPLSDTEMVQVKDRMYAAYDADLSQRWRR